MENRYDKYKDSGIAWIGEIPEHWEVTSFKRKITINNGKDYKDFLDAEVYPVMGSGGCFAYCSNYVYDGEALLLGRKGTIDKPLYVKGKFWAVDTMFYAIPHADLYCKFAYYLALMFPFNLYSTSTSLPSLTQTDLGNILVAFPFLSEQQAIAAYLDQKCGEIDELITLQEEMITKLQSYKQSVITEAVTKGLDKNVPLKDSGIKWIGKIPEHWSIICLKRLCRISTGNQDTQDSIPDGKYPFFVRSPKVERSNNYTFEGPSILMAGDGVGAGKVFHLADNKFACHQRVYCINQFSVIVNRIYLFYYMSSLFYNIIDSANSKSTVDSVRLPMLAEFPVCIPLKYEQQSIADYLDQKCSEIDELISIKQQKIEKLKEYKKSLIFECVTGKRKVS